jgi:hypothetical protein
MRTLAHLLFSVRAGDVALFVLGTLLGIGIGRLWWRR